MTDAPTKTYPTRVLALLLLAYVFNFLDRQILSILAIPIKVDLGLTDKQLGLMGGIAFASLYSTLAIPIARFADKGRRVATISLSMALWSGFTALCGAAGSFWQLFLARMGVGIGEAGGVAPSYALISDVVPPHRRARALAIFSLGIPIGSALGLFFGGWLATALNWRWAFVIIGLAGIPVAIALKLFVTEPRQGAQEIDAELEAANPPFSEVMALLVRKPSFWLLSFGAAAASTCGYGLAFWLPSFFTRSMGIPLDKLGLYYGSIVLVGGMLGIWLGGALGDKLGKSRPGAFAAVPAISFLLTGPLFALAILSPSPIAGTLLFIIPYMLSLTWLGPVVNAVQNLVPPAMRATASASMLLINNLIGIGFGTYLFGWLAERLEPTYGAESLRWSIIYGLGFYIVAGILMLGAAARLKRDWYRS